MHAVYDACRGGYTDIARTRIIVFDLRSVPVREEHPLKTAGLDRIYGIESVQYRSIHHSGAGGVAPGLHRDAVLHAKNYISGALAAGLDLGHGSGPMNHGFDIVGDYS